MRGLRLAVPLAAFCLTLAVSGDAFAQAGPAAGADPAAGATPAAGGTAPANTEVQATLRTEGGRRVYVATGTIEVRGEIQRPYAFSLSGRSSLGYSYLDTPVHFVQEILNALRHAPF